MKNNKELVILAGQGGGSGGSDHAVEYVEQSLTDLQKAQARTNIGATDESTAIPDNIKMAILNCFNHVAWADEHGQDCYDELNNALFNSVESISVVFDSENAVVCTQDALDDLRPYLTVTATYYGGTTGTVEGYSLSGSLDAGTQTITVTYGAATDTFSVSVRSATLLFSGVSVGPASNSYVETTVVSPFDFTMKTKANTISGSYQYNAFASFYGGAALFSTYGDVKGHRIRCYHTLSFEDAGGQGTLSNGYNFADDVSANSWSRLRFKSAFLGGVGTTKNGHDDVVVPLDITEWGGTGTVTNSSYLTYRCYWQALSGASVHVQLMFYDLGADS